MKEQIKIMGQIFEVEHVSYEAVKPMPKRPVIELTCSCCGNETTGRQWWNRDTGYGLCNACAQRISSQESPDEMKSCYGEKGVHYCI